MDNTKNNITKDDFENKLKIIALIYINNCLIQKLDEKKLECENRSNLLKKRYEEQRDTFISNNSSDNALKRLKDEFEETIKEIEKEKIQIQDYKSKYINSINEINDIDVSNNLDETAELSDDNLLIKIANGVLRRDISFSEENYLREYIRAEFERSFFEETDQTKSENLKSFQITQLNQGFENAIYIEGEATANPNFSDDEKETIRSLYSSKVTDVQKEIYPLNSVEKIVVISDYSNVDSFVEKEKTFKFMPPEDLFEIKANLRKYSIALYGYNDIFDVKDKDDIKKFPLTVRTEDNHFKSFMFIDNTNMRTFEVSEDNEEDMNDILSELDKEKYPVDEPFEVRQISSSKIDSLEEMILRYIKGYKTALSALNSNKVQTVIEPIYKEAYDKSDNLDSRKIVSTIKNDNDVNDFDENINQKDIDEAKGNSDKQFMDSMSEAIYKKVNQNNSNTENKNIENNNEKIEKAEKTEKDIKSNENFNENEYEYVIFIPVKNLLYVTPARIFIGVDSDSKDPKDKKIFSLSKEKDVFGYKGKTYFKVKDNYYNFVEIAPSKEKVVFKPNNKKVSKQFLMDNFMTVKIKKK